MMFCVSAQVFFFGPRIVPMRRNFTVTSEYGFTFMQHCQSLIIILLNTNQLYRS